MTHRPFWTRRRLMQSALSVAALGAAAPARAARLVRTPRQTAGPFYPDSFPLDSDNDLVQVEGREGRAQGTVAYLSGRVLDDQGRPVAGALVEIWQCDAHGRYHHPRDRGGRGQDPDFQGYGRTVAGDDGGYRFRTIKPVPYPGRTPHIHFAVSGAGLRPLTTQMYVAGHPLNQRDFVLNSIRDPQARASVIVPFVAAPEMEPGAVSATFDIVLGRTPPV